MRILVRHKGFLRKFVVVESSDRDGSLTLVMRREGIGASRTTWSTKPGEHDLKQVDFGEPRQKSKRITIHQSGRVNYHENGNSIFIEPLTRTSQATCVYAYRVPALEKLNLHPNEAGDEDAIFELSDLGDGPVSFSVFIGPSSLVPPGKAVKLAYDVEGYSLTIAVDAVPTPVPSGYEDHFITLTPERGIFLDQQVAEDQAMISYHRALTRSDGMVLYHPNGEGNIRLIFSVPMRIAPRFKIELADPELHVTQQDVQRDGRSEKVMLKFKIRNRRTGQIIRHEVAIKSIELDAEL
ncbi:hypothetical protein [Dyella sp.]|uniref:hypothetical protein n=1 Tax=Dyella sp. TaxID=1869338 RepID=UPI003F7F1BBB